MATPRDSPIRPSQIIEMDLNGADALPEAFERASDEDILTLSVPVRFQRRGMEMRMIIDGNRTNDPDPHLIRLVIKAHTLREKLLQCSDRRLSDVAAREGLSRSYLTRVLRLAFLSPDITRAILDGDHPPELNAVALERASRLPLEWQEQKRALGFP